MTKRIQSKLGHVFAAALLLGGCGGGGGSGNALHSTPPAPPPPPPPPPPPSNAASGLIAAAATSQAFAVEGGNLYYTGNLAVRYDAATGHYLVTVPGRAEALLEKNEDSPGSSIKFYRAGEMNLVTRASGTASDPQFDYEYSNLAQFNDGNALNVGSTAFGIPTLASAVPIVGSANYSGYLVGYSSESVDWGDWGIWAGWISGSVSLAFDFGAGSLAGSMNPILELDQKHDLGTLTFSQPVWSVGSPSFSAGLTGASLTGNPAGISGTFTGPTAQELIGGFHFGYVSPVTGLNAQAGGAFLAKR